MEYAMLLLKATGDQRVSSVSHPQVAITPAEVFGCPLVLRGAELQHPHQ